MNVGQRWKSEEAGRVRGRGKGARAQRQRTRGGKGTSHYSRLLACYPALGRLDVSASTTAALRVYGG
jgi:hypothetical protein